MIPPGLDQDGFAHYLQALRDGTRVTTSITVRPLADTTQILTIVDDERIIDDQIDFAYERHRADRTWSGGIDDPQHDLGMDTSSLTDGFGGLGVLLQPVRHVWVDALGRWVDVPQGGYRPLRPKRDGTVLVIEAPDKASLWMTPKMPGHLPANTNIFAVTRQKLRALGELDFAIPPLSATNAETGSKDIAVGGADEDLSWWQVLVDLNADHGWQLYYDERSRAAIRHLPGQYATPTAFFDASNMTAAPAPSTDQSVLRNFEHATGKGSGSSIAETNRALPRSHPLSPWSLRVNDVPFPAVDFSEKPNLDQHDLDDWVDEVRLPKVSTQTVEVEIRAFPQWHLTPLDRVQIEWEGVRYRVPVRSATVGRAEMTLGIRKNIRKPSAGRAGYARAAS